MGRPRNTTPTVELHVMVPADVVGRMSLLLYSDLQERIPLGAQAKFVTRALVELLDRIQKENGNAG